MNERPLTKPSESSPLNSVLNRNIDSLQQRRQEDEARASAEEKVADFISRFAGSMMFVYIHLAILVLWVATSLGWIPFVPAFDPTFVILATASSVEAIFLSTFILISQNRAAAVGDRRSDLDVQVSLLTEHEVTSILRLCTEMARHMRIREASDPKLDELKGDVAPERVLDEIEKKGDADR